MKKTIVLSLFSLFILSCTSSGYTKPEDKYDENGDVCFPETTRAMNPKDGQVKDFPTKCIPDGWIVQDRGGM